MNKKLETLTKIFIGSLFLFNLSCNTISQDMREEARKKEEKHYLSAVVKSERFVKGLISRDAYHFSLETEDGIRNFRSLGDARKLDALLDKGDTVIIDQEKIFGHTHVPYRSIVSVNNKKVIHQKY